MNFKLSRIVFATGMAFAATAALADPTGGFNPPSTYSTGTSDIYVAGSSAVDLALTKFIANTCVANTLDTYRTDAGGKTYYLWTCTAGAGFPLSSGNTKIAIHKNTNSSSDGTNAVANGAGTLKFLQVSDLGACNAAAVPVAATATIPAYNTFACGSFAGTADAVPKFGFSDSEPAQFATSAAIPGQLTTVYPLTIIFGVPVTKNVRDLLQTAQNLGHTENEVDMPSLTSQQISSIFSNRTKTWTDLGLTVNGSDNNIYVVRRSGGSGTTRAFDVTFMGDFCTPGAAAIETYSGIANVTVSQCVAGTPTGATTARVSQTGTSDDMANCLSSYNTTNVGAIGYLSTDYTPQLADGYRWVKIDGYSPKQLNVVDGKWKAWSEESLNYNTALGLTSDESGFYNSLKAFSASGTLLSEVSKNLPQVTSGLWTGGILGAVNNARTGWGLAPAASRTLPRDENSVLTYPANPFTRNGASGYSLCLTPLPASGYQAH